ncbi:rRNA maturation RNase YbeY [Vagococcus humatus]|uniref:Endoribonuclease YbeY n=1 Tax=Vagococcus humatus TaxID=1889241 RepID=A0A429Z751_9ENTE|nr:rRNA maturation RNase YbeY [Vagococcus humatus]RST89560.1 rRNA maturation RNase YbeY [Vagococcus humatus]
MDITLIDETNSVTDSHSKLVEDILQYAGTVLELPENTEMSVTFVNNQAIQEVNRDYRGKDAPTDVISFAIEELGEGEIPINFEGMEGLADLPRNIGDILISTERTQEQADDYGHSFERELGFLAIHGFLHLNGYDHMNPEEEKEMFSLQRKILEDYGLQR